MTTVGHNGVAGAELAQFIERIQRLEELKAGISSDIKDVYSELKGRGFDAKTVRQIIKIQKMDADERAEQEALLELYLAALCDLKNTPLGDYALASRAA
jgi:uncharacterized protein (UPF0335 family)